MNSYISKVDYLYDEYSNDKANGKNFVDSNENINSISNNKNNNS